MGRPLIGCSNSTKVKLDKGNTSPQSFHVKVIRGNVSTWWNEDTDKEVETREESTDFGSLSDARVRSRQLMYDETKQIDCTEVEIVTK